MNFYDGGNDSPKTLAVKRGVIEWFWNNANSRRITPEANYHGWVVDVLAYVDRGRWKGAHVVEVKVTKSDFQKDMVSDESLKTRIREKFDMRGAIRALRRSAEREARIRVGGHKSRFNPSRRLNRRVGLQYHDERRQWTQDKRYQHAVEIYDTAMRRIDQIRFPKVKFLSSCFACHTDFCWLAAPDGLIDPGELPPDFGLFVMRNDGSIRVRVRPTRIDPVIPTADYALAEIARRSTQLLLKRAGVTFGPGAMRIPREDL